MKLTKDIRKEEDFDLLRFDTSSLLHSFFILFFFSFLFSAGSQFGALLYSDMISLQVAAIFIREAEASSVAREANSIALECQNVSLG